MHICRENSAGLSFKVLFFLFDADKLLSRRDDKENSKRASEEEEERKDIGLIIVGLEQFHC